MWKHKQAIPLLFQEIMDNDRERSAMQEKPAIPLKDYAALMERRAMLTREAEYQLHWNKDKGSTA